MTLLVTAIATSFDAYLHCTSEGANESQREWAQKHLDNIKSLVRANIPSGGGLDNGVRLKIQSSKANKLVFSTSFHHMTDQGVYDVWTHHNVIVTPSLAFGFELRVTGPDRKSIKEYITQTFDLALRAEVQP